jgi:hypothetical protein
VGFWSGRAHRLHCAREGEAIGRLTDSPDVSPRPDPTAVLNHKSKCADCGDTFAFKTPNRERFEPNRRCQAHRKPGLVHRADNDQVSDLRVSA